MAIEIISTLKPKNNGTFPIAEAKDIAVDENGTRLDAKLAELANNCGCSGGGCGCIIDVTELPTEGINEQSIYRLANAGGAEVYAVVPDGGGYVRKTIADVLGESIVVLVTEDPQNETLSEFTETFAVYVQRSTGVAYINYGGTIMTMGAAMEGSADGGWSTDVNNETPEVPTVYTVSLVTYTYHACKNGVWTELSNSESGSSGGITYIELDVDIETVSNASGTITDEQLAAILADPKNSAILIGTGGSYNRLPLTANLADAMYAYTLTEFSGSSVNTDKVIIDASKNWVYSKTTKVIPD